MRKPTSLIVIAVLWLLIGASWILSGLPGIATAMSAQNDLAAQGGRFADDAQTFLGWTIAALVAEAAAGIAAIVFAIGMLRLRAWGRRGLEVMTVLLMIGVVIFMLKIVATGIQAELGVFVFGGLMGIVAIGWPLWIMRRHLRGRAIHEAIANPAYYGASVS